MLNKGPADKQDVSNKHRNHATEWSITLQAGFRALITLITNISDDEDDEDDDVGGGCQGPVSQECVKNPDSVGTSKVRHTKLKLCSARRAETTKTRHKRATKTLYFVSFVLSYAQAAEQW